jgi:hypothetical protein
MRAGYVVQLEYTSTRHQVLVVNSAGGMHARVGGSATSSLPNTALPFSSCPVTTPLIPMAAH